MADYTIQYDPKLTVRFSLENLRENGHGLTRQNVGAKRAVIYAPLLVVSKKLRQLVIGQNKLPAAFFIVLFSKTSYVIFFLNLKWRK